VRWAIAIPQLVDEVFDSRAFGTYLARAEALEFEGAWTLDQVLGTAGLLSPLETMTYAAACTRRLRLGCAVFVSTLHQPVHLAKAISSLDQLSGGRLDVGVGLGGRRRQFSAFGLDPDGLVARFNEGIQIMKSLWTEPAVTFDGRFWQLDKVAMEPKPIQKPHPPLWLGGSAPPAVRRAIRHGDGFFGAGSSTTAAFGEQVRVVQRKLEQLELDRRPFPIAKRCYIAVDDDGELARRRLAAGLIRVYGPDLGPRLEPVGVSGTPDQCVRGLQDVADAGAELILLNPLFDQLAQMERLAAEVIPRLS
jgi:probable F420-dependent oxidoreductase